MKKEKAQELLNKMDEYTMKRWSALIDGVQMIAIKAEKLNKKAEYKTGVLNRYIDEITEKIKVY